MTQQPTTTPRNPGPSWGYHFLRLADRVLPEWLYRPLRALGTWIALAFMKRQRDASRAYLSLALGRPPTLREVFSHFFAFEETLMLKFRLANGLQYPCKYKCGGEDFKQWMEQGGPVMLGTLHIGVSDLLGFQLGGKVEKAIYMVRQRVGNSHDTEVLSRKWGQGLRMVWVNHPDEVLFALKEAAATEHAIVMQCDRLGHTSRTETFEFFGARRIFPFSIYHLAMIFRRPVILAFGLPGEGNSWLYASPRFESLPGEARAATLARAREHFQDFLRLVEGALKEQPKYWFNFEPMNPVAVEEGRAS